MRKKAVDPERIEAKITALELEDVEPDQAHLDEIRERAHAEYLRRTGKRPVHVKTKQRNGTQKRGRRIGQKVMVASCLAVLILVAGFAMNVVAPMAIGSANNTMRRVGIWMNDTFKLGMEFSAPVEGGGEAGAVLPGEYSSFSEIPNSSGIPLICIDDEDYKVDRIDIINPIEDVYETSIIYRKDINYVQLMIMTLGDKSNAFLSDENVEYLNLNIGDIYIWRVDELMRAMLVYDGHVIQIDSDLQHDEFISMCSSLKAVTEL